jgi:hypothetical protein
MDTFADGADHHTPFDLVFGGLSGGFIGGSTVGRFLVILLIGHKVLLL